MYELRRITDAAAGALLSHFRDMYNSSHEIEWSGTRHLESRLRGIRVPRFEVPQVKPERGSSRLGRHVHEAGQVTLEGDRCLSGRAVAVLGNDDVRLAGTWRFPLVHVLSMHQQHHVSVLLDRA